MIFQEAPRCKLPNVRRSVRASVRSSQLATFVVSFLSCRIAQGNDLSGRFAASTDLIAVRPSVREQGGNRLATRAEVTHPPNRCFARNSALRRPPDHVSSPRQGSPGTRSMKIVPDPFDDLGRVAPSLRMEERVSPAGLQVIDPGFERCRHRAAPFNLRKRIESVLLRKLLYRQSGRPARVGGPSGCERTVFGGAGCSCRLLVRSMIVWRRVHSTRSHPWQTRRGGARTNGGVRCGSPAKEISEAAVRSSHGRHGYLIRSCPPQAPSLFHRECE